MTHGPGKYDDAATVARESTEATGVILVVIGGNKGLGFSAQTTDPAVLLRIPDILENVARQIRDDVEGV